MKIDVALLPALLRPEMLSGRSVVVFDVLRATTTMTAALAAGAREIRVFDSLDAAQRSARTFDGARLLCGEAHCLPPAGFDLGNSPASFSATLVAGKTLFMCTTNGTRALVAARSAKRLYIGALTNAAAVAEVLAREALDHTLLLCAGTSGEIATEDAIGAGAVLHSLAKMRSIDLASDSAEIALNLYQSAGSDLRSALRNTRGGRNVIEAGLPADIDYAAQINRTRTVGACDPETLVVQTQLN